jgi:hypothetical protein
LNKSAILNFFRWAEFLSRFSNKRSVRIYKKFQFSLKGWLSNFI